MLIKVLGTSEAPKAVGEARVSEREQDGSWGGWRRKEGGGGVGTMVARANTVVAGSETRKNKTKQGKIKEN